MGSRALDVRVVRPRRVGVPTPANTVSAVIGYPRPPRIERPERGPGLYNERAPTDDASPKVAGCSQYRASARLWPKGRVMLGRWQAQREACVPAALRRSAAHLTEDQ
jgi:hypothetical protein